MTFGSTTDANDLVVICMVLTVNTTSNDDNTETVSYDFGNIGMEDRPFDTVVGTKLSGPSAGSTL